METLKDSINNAFEQEIVKFIQSNYYYIHGTLFDVIPAEKIHIHNKVVDVDLGLEIKPTSKITKPTNGTFKFGTINGSFDISNSNLVSLEGSPDTINGYFNCDGCNKLISLEGAPQNGINIFSCDKCKKLTTLKGSPKKISGDFSCNGCINLISLEGAPEYIDGNFDCRGCVKLNNDSKKYLPQIIYRQGVIKLPKQLWSDN